MPDPKVSIIIPAHNASTFIGGALRSVLSQGYDESEVVVVNDGSTDDLEAAIRPYVGGGKVVYTATGNKGVSGALNTGLGLASGDYVAFLHADDIYLPGKIKKQVSFLEANPDIGVSYTGANYFLEGGESTVDSPYVHFSGDIFYFLKRNNFIHMSTTAFRRDVLNDMMFDEGLACHEDWDLFLRLAARRMRFGYLDEILSSICIHPKSLSANTAVMDATRREVGNRARSLWKEFKKGINIYSPEGISSLGRYLTLKTRALLIGFPNRKRFIYKAPSEMFSRYVH